MMDLRRLHNSEWKCCLLSWVFCILCLKALCDVPEVNVKFLQKPPQLTHKKSADFVFEAFVSSSTRESCANCTFNCKLDDEISTDCGGKNVSFSGLRDGYHSLKVCTNALQGVACASYNWTVDTIHPTAYISSTTTFTSAPNVTIHISFTEPCTGGGGFVCSSVNACNLLVYGAGQVIPDSLETIQPYLKYSIVVGLSTESQYGRAIIVMDRGFCTDNAGNRFIRLENSSIIVHFDRRNVYVNLRTHIPEKLLKLNGDPRTVLATNSSNNLKVYFYFTEPVLNTSTEILNSVDISDGSLRPINGSSFANRRFGYMIENVASVSIVTLSLNSTFVISKKGSPVSPVAPATFLYDSKRPTVMLSTKSKMRTRETTITVIIKFFKPIFGFNSTHLSISGGKLQEFRQINRSIYVAMLQAFEGIMAISIPENMTADVAGNRNLASNVLHVRHYSLPMISNIFCISVTAIFLATCLVAGLLTISTASLQAFGAYPRSSAALTTNPTKKLFRIACYIQMFALSRWLAVTLPVEYYEFTKGIEWSIPYFCLPWETNHYHGMFSPDTYTSSHINRASLNSLSISQPVQFNKGISNKAGVVYGAPLTDMEYRLFFENQNYIPEAEYIMGHETGWRNFGKGMFWLGVIGGSLIVLHIFLLLVLKFRKSPGKLTSYGALIFPRFEIFLLILAIPCICQASTTLIKGGTTFGKVIAILLFIFASSWLLALFLFLSFGITCGRLLQYKEVHQVERKFHWYQELVRVTLGPGKRGQWTWKSQQNSIYLAKFGPLFEDLRGPPKYMLSMITGESHMPVDRIIASDDETEDAEAPFIQRLFGVLRIYYTLLESIRRFLFGILAGLHSENSVSKTPTIILLSITSFQLFFLVLKKPFIKKKVQLVEILSIACEVGMFSICFVLLEREFTIKGEKVIGIIMLCLFIFGFLGLIANEWYALFKQVRKLDSSKNKFQVGLKAVLLGFILLFLPEKMVKPLEKWLPDDKPVSGNGEVSRSGTNRTSETRSPSMSDKPWLKQLREMAKASFKEASGSTTTGTNDPSGSNPRWSGFWRGKWSGSSSKTPSRDYKSKPKSLYKDLEDIFASK